MIYEDVKMRRCEDKKMIDRPPLLEEPFAQTLSGKKQVASFLELGEGLQMEDLRAEPTTLTAALGEGMPCAASLHWSL